MVDSLRPFGRLHEIERLSPISHIVIGLIFVWFSNSTISFSENTLQSVVILIGSFAGFWFASSLLESIGESLNYVGQYSAENTRLKHAGTAQMTRKVVYVKETVVRYGTGLLSVFTVVSVFLARSSVTLSVVPVHIVACSVTGYICLFLVTHSFGFSAQDSITRFAMSTVVSMSIVFAAFYGSAFVRSFWLLIALVVFGNVLSIFDFRKVYIVRR